MRLRSRPFPVHGLKSILVVAPHPDDETLGCGGILALVSRAGGAAHVVFVTDGRASHPSHPSHSADEIASLRKDEAKAATGTLGVDWNRVFFVDAADGTLAGLGPGASGDIVSKLAAIVAQTAPDAVLLTWRRDGSSDHDASAILVGLAVKKAGRKVQMLEYPIWAWRNPLLLLEPILTSRTVWRVDTREVQSLKAAALDAYVSQTRPIPPDTSPVISPEFTAEFMLPEEFLFEK
jgi:LmbE family N-acetylglucosaminyl deacetylase